MKRKIAVFTGTRAEYGLLKPLMKEIRASSTLELQLIVSGAHLTTVHGNTWQQIEADGFVIDERVDMLLASDSAIGVTKSMGLGLIGFAESLHRLQPDILVVLGDRYEALAIATAAMIARIPIAHIHGGESTEGLIDEAIRHSITKMAHLHFVAADEFKGRVLRLGEQPERVWVVGAAGLDNIADVPIISRWELESFLKLELKRPVVLLTYHPVTLCLSDSATVMSSLLRILKEIAGTIVITGANADPGGEGVREVIARFAAENATTVRSVDSLGVERYLSLMRCADLVVGNSSSGLLEAPAIGVPTVDIGDRQAGRLRAQSVVHCGEAEDEIRNALKHALSQQHRDVCTARATPYGQPGAARRILEVLESVSLEGILKKRFYDYGF